VNIEEFVTNQIQKDVEVLEAPCGDGVWHIERCPPMSHVQCFALQKSSMSITVFPIQTSRDSWPIMFRLIGMLFELSMVAKMQVS
jgi:hypothetical protein